MCLYLLSTLEETSPPFLWQCLGLCVFPSWTTSIFPPQEISLTMPGEQGYFSGNIMPSTRLCLPHWVIYHGELSGLCRWILIKWLCDMSAENNCAPASRWESSELDQSSPASRYISSELDQPTSQPASALKASSHPSLLENISLGRQFICTAWNFPHTNGLFL